MLLAAEAAGSDLEAFHFSTWRKLSGTERGMRPGLSASTDFPHSTVRAVCVCVTREGFGEGKQKGECHRNLCHACARSVSSCGHFHQMEGDRFGGDRSENGYILLQAFPREKQLPVKA